VGIGVQGARLCGAYRGLYCLTNKRRESTHAACFGGRYEREIVRIRGVTALFFLSSNLKPSVQDSSVRVHAVPLAGLDVF
jgi:hypothetical protein